MPSPALSPFLAAMMAASGQPVQGEIALQMHSLAPEINPAVVQRAADALVCASQEGKVKTGRYAVVDFSLPNTSPRMWIFDLQNNKLLSRQLVSHGSGSGRSALPSSFSNTPGSNASSLGLYRVAESYRQVGGAPMDAGPAQTNGLDPLPRARLDGLTPGFNTNARSRAVVIHSSGYVTPKRAGLSQGCFSVERSRAADTVAWLKNGEGLYADAPDPVFQAYMKTLASCPAVIAARQQTQPWWVAQLATPVPAFASPAAWPWAHTRTNPTLPTY